MNIQKVSLSTPNYSTMTNFKGNQSKDSEYENPVSRSTERNLAILKTTGGAAVLGAIATGLMTCIVNTEKHAGEGFFKKNKIAVLVGAATSAITLALNLPSSIYNTNVNAFVKQKEMDVFTRDRDLKSNLTEGVDTEVKNPDISLDKKLDDNLKLQMANRGAAIGIANVTAQPQG